jgi:hypothetical protein
MLIEKPVEVTTDRNPPPAARSAGQWAAFGLAPTASSRPTAAASPLP